MEDRKYIYFLTPETERLEVCITQQCFLNNFYMFSYLSLS